MTNKANVVKVDDSSGSASIIFDTRYFPFCILSMVEPPTMELAEKYYEMRHRLFFERAAAEKTKVVHITDMTRSGAPPATIRKYLGDMGKRYDPVTEELLGYVAVVPNSVIRGVVTALTWIVGDDVKPVSYASSVQNALDKALVMAKNAGVHVGRDHFEYVPWDQ